ncbi:MAG: DUF721 domain-containing protein [Desulfovibrionaceae bacterium]|nr:DUF721 domain-containing protein [Desulfovibrionaceae bacterium]
MGKSGAGEHRQNVMLSVSDCLRMLVCHIGKPEQEREFQLWSHWNIVMGSELSQMAFPLGRKNAVLIVGGEDGIAMQELSFRIPEILQRANAFMDSAVFQKVELRLMRGKRPLNKAVDDITVPGNPLMMQCPKDIGRYLDTMDPDSPVAKSYRAYLESFGISAKSRS